MPAVTEGSEFESRDYSKLISLSDFWDYQFFDANAKTTKIQSNKFFQL